MRLLNSAFVFAHNHLLKRSAWALERLRGFSGKRVALAVGSIKVVFSIDDQGYLLDTGNDDGADVLIEIPLTELPFLAGNGTAAGSRSTLRLDGDAELAETVGFVLRNLRWDLEEDMARLLGDVLAHRIGRAARSTHRAHLRAWESVRDNTLEYLTEETGLLLTRAQAAELTGPLIALRDDLARCEKRLERVSRTLRA